MTFYNSLLPGRIIMGRLQHGADLLEELTDICRKEKIQQARIEALGAVQKARIGFYCQEKREYQFREFDRHLEITTLGGNVSLKDGEPFVHAHITLADSEGNALGGHLAAGTVVFACEFTIQELSGVQFRRSYDDITGLHLWNP